MGSSKNQSTSEFDADRGQGCIVGIITLTLFVGYLSTVGSLDPFPFVVALGLSAVAASILYLAISVRTKTE
ncbi:MAG: hypothetical protein ACFFDM_12785 [Candidatus Thorarchaeota archaeon]